MSIFMNIIVVFCRVLWYNTNQVMIMYLKVGKSNGKTHLSFVQGYRDGGKVKQRTIETLGFLEDFWSTKLIKNTL